MSHEAVLTRLRDLGLGHDDLRVNVSSMGATQLPITSIAAAAGLNIRVGLEDNVMLRRRQLATSNAELVERTVRVLRAMDREIATPAQARSILGLRGRSDGAVPQDPLSAHATANH